MYRARVLIIEDDRKKVEELQVVFEKGGYESEVALHPEVGLAIVNERKMDVVVVDAGLQNDGSIKTVEKIKVLDPEVPILMINMSGTKQEQKVARSAGATRFLKKPTDAEQVVSTVSRVIRN